MCVSYSPHPKTPAHPHTHMMIISVVAKRKSKALLISRTVGLSVHTFSHMNIWFKEKEENIRDVI